MIFDILKAKIRTRKHAHVKKKMRTGANQTFDKTK